MTRPSRKWFVTQVTAVAAWLVAFAQAGYDLNTTLVIAGIGVVSQAAISWATPNTAADLRRQRPKGPRRAR